MSVMLFFLERGRRSLLWSSGGDGCMKPHCLVHSAPLVCTAGQEGAELANILTKSTRNGCLVSLHVCNEFAHLLFVRVN